MWWMMVAGFVVAGGGWVYGGDCDFWFFENRFLHAIPNTKNTFPANFPKHKQTIENIFLFIKYFKLKIFYTRKIFYILPNTA